MITYKQFLTEQSYKDLIVIDVQEAFTKEIYFDLEDFGNYIMRTLENGKEVNYFFAGEELTSDSVQSVIEFLSTECYVGGDYIDQINFIEKEWGYIRAFMDQGIDEEEIIIVLKELIKKRELDVRSIDTNSLKLNDEIKELIEYGEVLYLPDLENEILNLPSKSEIIGGGQDECLLEMEIIFNAYKKKTKRNNKFIY